MDTKPGWKTTEFWFSLAAMLDSAAYASGLLATGSMWDRIAGFAAMALTALGYTVTRGRVKTATALVTPQQSRPPQSGRAILPVMLALAALGGAVAIGCAARQRASAGVGAFLDCEAAQLPADTLKDATSLATTEIRHLIGGTGAVDVAALKADMAPLKTNLLRCAFAGAMAALTPPQTARMATGVDLRGAFAAASAELGWPSVRPVGGAAP